MGAELLLHDVQVYARVGALLDRLREWQASHPDRGIPLPLTGELEIFEGAFDDIAVAVRRSVAARDRVWRWWNTRSQRPFLPGYSLLELFEFVGIWMQVEWLARAFRPDIAEVVSTAILMDERRVTKYFRPGIVMAQLNASDVAGYEPDQQDPSRLFWSTLNTNGVDETVDDGRATDRHAGTWFGLFVQRLMDGNRPRNVPVGLESAWAAEDVLKRHGVPGLGERFDAADRSLNELQSSTLRALVGESELRVSEPLLVALDVATDYRTMNSVIRGRPDYHRPQTYVELLLSGEFPAVHVRVMGRDGLEGNFRTPSSIPPSQVGGAHAASEASQQMRLLLEGRGTTMEPYSASVLAALQAQPPAGRGLRFRLGKPPPRRRLGPTA